jgi:hypothetical protein
MTASFRNPAADCRSAIRSGSSEFPSGWISSEKFFFCSQGGNIYRKKSFNKFG